MIVYSEVSAIQISYNNPFVEYTVYKAMPPFREQ